VAPSKNRAPKANSVIISKQRII